MTQNKIETRQRIERRIVTAAVEGLLAAGYQLAVIEDGRPAKHTSDKAEILAELFACDEETLFAQKDGKHAGFVSLVYGNDGWDVICDNTCSLERALTAATELAEKLEEQHG